jgi:hypothetical protein
MAKKKTPPPQNGQANGHVIAPRRERFKRQLPDGQPHQDPAKAIPSAPPNFGRPLISHVLTFQGTSSSWSHVYRNSDEAIRHSRENARFMRNDPAIMECLEARQRGTALLGWHLEGEDAKDPKQKQLVTDLTGIVERIPNFTEYRRCLLEALWYGRYANQHEWGHKFVRGVRRTTVVDWTPVLGDKLAFRFDDGTGRYSKRDIGIRCGTTMTKADKIAGERKLEPTDWGMAYFLEDWERPLLAVHKHIIEDGAFEDPLSAGRIHGVGIRDRIYWCWFQKQETMAHLMEVIERTGTGFTIYYFQAGNPQSETRVREIAESHTKDNVVVVPWLGPDGPPPMDRIEPTTQGIDALKTVIHEFFGHQIKRYILGQILSTESAGTGLGSGVADLHHDTFSGIIQYDATKLEETITNELVEHIKAYNFPWARNIYVRFKIDTKTVDADEKLEAVKKAWDMGAKLKATDVMDLIGFSAPDEDDEVLANPAMQQQQRLWDQTHPEGGGAPGGSGGQPAPEGSDGDLFGPLMGAVGGQGGAPGGEQPPQAGKPPAMPGVAA